MVAATRGGACSTQATASAVVMCSKTTPQIGDPSSTSGARTRSIKSLFTIENIDIRIGGLAVNQQWKAVVGHGLEGRDERDRCP